MNIRTIKKPQRRVDVSYVTRFNMQSYGFDNLYPQDCAKVAAASGTADLCIARYARFIEGYGFEDAAVADLAVNRQGTTADELLHLLAADLARFGGFALHVNYNALCEVADIHFVPFEQCRLEEPDDTGHVGHILLHPDWEQKTTRGGKRLLVSEQTVERFNIFNPSPEVVAQEIANVGGVDKYNGQILWVSKDGACVYPRAVYDSALTDLSTDEGLGNIKYRNVRNNFLVSCMLVTRKGEMHYAEDGAQDEDSRLISDDDLRAFQGDERALKILGVEIDKEEDKPEVVPFPTKNYDKEFSVTDASVVERIYAQFGQELFYAIRIGKLGFSGKVMQDAYEYYAGTVTTEQRIIQRALGNILAHWHDESMRGLSCIIQPLKYISADSADNNSIKNEQ